MLPGKLTLGAELFYAEAEGVLAGDGGDQMRSFLTRALFNSTFSLSQAPFDTVFNDSRQTLSLSAQASRAFRILQSSILRVADSPSSLWLLSVFLGLRSSSYLDCFSLIASILGEGWCSWRRSTWQP